jgi:oligoendopeptidase F
MKVINKRSDIADAFKWNVEDIYPNREAWDRDVERLKSLLPQIRSFNGTLTSAVRVRTCFELSDEINLVTERLYVYAHLKHHEETGDAEHQAPVAIIKQLAVDVSEAMSFIDPELVALPEAMLRGFLADPQLAVYRFTLDDVIRRKPHTLPKEQEALLAKAGVMAQAPQTIYSMLNNADMKFPSIKDETGNEVELTHARYSRFLESRDRRVRRDAFEAMFATYAKQKNTIASIYNANVQKDVFYSKALRFNSSLEAALFGDNIPPAVYANLIEAVRTGLPAFRRYLAARKRMLALDELRLYDLNVPLVPDFEWTITYDEARNIVTEALSPLGPEYQEIVGEAWSRKWIDVYENEGKRSGAYSWGAYGTHPYILLNHEDTLHGVFTIAHEMGHALHSYLADRTQPFRYAGYTIFIAEIASTLNEALLMEYLLKRSTDERQKLYLLTHWADNFRGTMFVQTMFAEFEKITHEMAEAGEPLTLETLNDIYFRLHQQYYGDALTLDDEVRYGWMRIPHFYTSFYVYKYATGFSAANSFSQTILSDGLNSTHRYLDLLRSGGSDYPLELLKRAGLDMRSPEPITNALSVFDGIVSELERLS